ncbi:MAG: hypothetical protein HQ553_09035 [Chloroflexi bacterium]|nr:hypothetical protein [Chloroflexota bacterium]
MHAARVADYLKSEAGIEAEKDSGGQVGEFTVWVDGKCVIKKKFLRFPEKERILAAIQRESS